MSVPKLQEAKPYLIRPLDTFEAVYGKATLLTDTMIAQMIDILREAKPTTPDAEETLQAVWNKLMGLWGETPPYEESGDT